MKIGVNIRELVARAGQVAPVVALVHNDEQLLFAEGTMDPIETTGGYVVGARVVVTRRDPNYPLTEINMIVDPEKGVNAAACGAAIERTKGAETVAYSGGGIMLPNATVNSPQLLPLGEWRRRLGPEGDLPPKPPAPQNCVAFYFEMPTPPAITYGVVEMNRAIRTLSGGLKRIGSYFPETDYRLRKALEDKPKNIATRVAWAFGAVAGNIEDLTLQLITLPSGRQRWCAEGVVVFDNAMQVHAARGLLYGLSQIYGIYPKPPNPKADPFDKSNLPSSDWEDPFDDLNKPSRVY